IIPCQAFAADHFRVSIGTIALLTATPTAAPSENSEMMRKGKKEDSRYIQPVEVVGKAMPMAPCGIRSPTQSHVFSTSNIVTPTLATPPSLYNQRLCASGRHDGCKRSIRNSSSFSRLSSAASHPSQLCTCSFEYGAVSLAGSRCLMYTFSR